MANVHCQSCGRTYDYEKYGCCPNCGAYNRRPRREWVDVDGTVHHGARKQEKVCYEKKTCYEEKAVSYTHLAVRKVQRHPAASCDERVHSVRYRRRVEPDRCGGAAGRTGTVWEELSPCKASA